MAEDQSPPSSSRLSAKIDPAAPGVVQDESKRHSVRSSRGPSAVETASHASLDVKDPGVKDADEKATASELEVELDSELSGRDSSSDDAPAPPRYS